MEHAFLPSLARWHHMAACFVAGVLLSVVSASGDMLARASGPSAQTMTGAVAGHLEIEVFYKTNCPHCLAFLSQSLLPLIEARLPGDRVQITLLPFLESGKPRSLLDCLSLPDCSAVLPHLCGLQSSLPPPAPADSLALLRGVRFATCNLAATFESSHHGARSVEHCAREASLPWDEMYACLGEPHALGGEQAFGILATPEDYSRSIRRVVKRFRDAGYNRTIGMPWVFFNGQHLACGGPSCTAFRTPHGDVAFGQPSSLLYLACSALKPIPAVCLNITPLVQDTPAHTVRPRQDCQNCAAFGSFRRSSWQQQQQQQQPQRHVQAVQILLAVTLNAALVGALGRALGRCVCQRGDGNVEIGTEGAQSE